MRFLGQMFGENMACGVLCSTCYVLFEQFGFPTHVTGSFFLWANMKLVRKRHVTANLFLSSAETYSYWPCRHSSCCRQLVRGSRAERTQVGRPHSVLPDRNVSIYWNTACHKNGLKCHSLLCCRLCHPAYPSRLSWCLWKEAAEAAMTFQCSAAGRAFPALPGLQSWQHLCKKDEPTN